MNQRKTQILCLAIAVVLIGVVFAGFTQHVWEDYYITYRSSKNLAQGNGLVFNPGERIHTFTSPLGVLLPAVASWVTGTEADQAALWIYRLMSLLALAAGAGFIFVLVRNLGMPAIPALLAGAWLALDAKTLDFSINGMETGLWVGFLAYAIWAQLGGRHRWIHLGIAWAGLMWTRPDCFIHISLLAAAGLIFMPGPKEEKRSEVMLSFIKAGLVTTVLYLPWFLWAWSYYGTPVPHTVEAKGGLSGATPILDQLRGLMASPQAFFGHENSIGATFLPAYYELEGWGNSLIWAGRICAWLVGIAWMLPRVSRTVRWLSLVFLGIHAYLSLVPYYFFPWYLPATIPFAIVVWAGVIRDWSQVDETAGMNLRQKIAIGVMVLTVGASTIVTGMVGVQMRAQQSLIEDGNRRLIGEYLAAHAEPGDAVFTEPLGYIGYFSGLRTYDFPGMSSPEMVLARELVGGDWKDLIDHLQPEWLVLRPREVERIENATNWRLSHTYQLAKNFDRSEEVTGLSVPGIGYLKHDATFGLYRRYPMGRNSGDGWRGRSDFPITFHERDWGGRFDLHAEAEMFFEIPEGARRVTLQVGYPGGGDQVDPHIDGVRIATEIRDWPRGQALQSFFIDPPSQEEGIWLAYDLPENLSAGAELRVMVTRKIWRNHDNVHLFYPGFEF